MSLNIEYNLVLDVSKNRGEDYCCRQILGYIHQPFSQLFLHNDTKLEKISERQNNPINQLKINIMYNASFTPYQRLELKKMSTEKIISIIRIAAKNYDDTTLILTPRIGQSGQAYYWTRLRYGECTELDFKLCLNKEIEAFILCFLSLVSGKIPD